MVELRCLIKEKNDWFAMKKGPKISPARQGGPKKQNPRILQFVIKDTTV